MSASKPESAELPFMQLVAPDTVVMRPGEHHEPLEHLAQILGARAKEGPFYFIVDFTRMKGAIDADMRERGPKLIKPEWLLGCVYINPSVGVRLALKVFNLAMFLSGKTDFPTEYATSEAEAHLAVERMRKEREKAS